MSSDLADAELMLERSRFAPAEKIARRILATETSRALREPERYARAHEVLARAHLAVGKWSSSIVEWERAVRLHPTARALAGLAGALWPTGQYARRAALLRRAIILDDRPEYHAHLGEMLATLGDWPGCWAEYEARHRIPNFHVRTGLTPPLGVPRWEGTPGLTLGGRSIAILHEGGYGDAIHFIRYCRLLRELDAGRIVFQAPAAMLRLLRDTGLADEVVDRDKPLPATDCYVPLQSLPHAFQTTPATIPWWGPYVPGRSPERLAGAVRGPAVGFVWQGAPHNPTDRKRSADPVAFAQFLTTLRTGSARLVSLQFGAETRPQLAPVAGFARLEWPRIASEWTETRDLLAGFDLLVSVDTAMVHLAGAMGVPCWMLIAGSNDWRWLEYRNDTPWYPSVRLLRMRRPDDWRGLLKTVGEELEMRYGADA